jgi:hypothetical protein
MCQVCPLSVLKKGDFYVTKILKTRKNPKKQPPKCKKVISFRRKNKKQNKNSPCKV